MRTKSLFILYILLIALISCKKEQPKSIDISTLDPQLVSRANLITKDYFTLAKTASGFIELKNKSYLSNVLKAGFDSYNNPYSQSPKIFKHILGEVSERELINAEPKGLVTRFKYTAKSTLQEKPIDFWIDINQDYRLAKMYIFTHHVASGERVNLFKDAYLKF